MSEIVHSCVYFLLCAEYGLRLASHIFVKDISPESLAARDGNIQEGDVVLKVWEVVSGMDQRWFQKRTG